MTLEEAIKHAEEVANNKCNECGQEHRQLAEWLKDYKRLLEQEPCKREIEREYLFQSLCEDFKKLQAENDDLRKRLEQESCEDCISRQAVLDMATTIQTDDFSGNEIIEVVDVAQRRTERFIL